MASYYGLGIRAVADSPTVIKELEAQDDAAKLTLFGCGLRSLRGLPPLRQLTELVLAANELGPSLDALFPALSTCTLLTTLDLSQNALESLVTKNRLPSLEVLDVSSNKLRSLDGLATFAPSLKKCKTHDNLEPLEWEQEDDVDALVERALRTSVEVPRPADRRKMAAMASATTVQFEEARRQRLRADAVEKENAMLDEALVAAHARVEELEERLRSCQQQVASAERKATRSLRRAEAEAQDLLRTAAARRVVGALRRYEDGASLKSVRDVFAYWRRGTHAVTSQSRDAKHAAACDSLRKDLEAAHRRHAALSDELNDAHDERLAFEASRASAAEARTEQLEARHSTIIDEREAALEASLHARAADDERRRAAEARQRSDLERALNAELIRERRDADDRFAHAAAAGAVAFAAIEKRAALCDAALVEAKSRDASARQQLAELKRAYAALAAREAESAARANQGEAREASLRDALAEVSEFTRLQKSALVDATAAAQRAEAAKRDAEAALRRDRVAFRQRLDAAEAEAVALSARRREDNEERARLDALVHESVEAAEEARRVVLERDETVRAARAAREAADAAAAASSDERSRLHESVDELQEDLDKARRVNEDGGRKLRLSREAERRLRGVVAELRAHPRDDHELETVESKLAERERELKYAEAELAGLSSVFEAKERDLRAGLEAERRQLELRARDAVEVSEQAQQDAMDARNLVGELRARLRGALEKTAAPETEPPPEPPSSACPY